MKKTKPPSRRGIIAAGDWSLEHTQSNPNSSFNLLLHLARWKAPFPLAGAGMLNRDKEGRFVLGECRRHHIDPGLLRAALLARTSSRKVTVKPAAAMWDGAGLNLTRNKARIFHLSGLAKLHALNASHPEFGTKAAALLRAAQQAGLKTCVDVTGQEDLARCSVCLPVLKFADYCILDEAGADSASGFKIRRPDGKINAVSLRHAAGAMLQRGVRQLVVLRFPEGGFIRTRTGGDFWQRGLKIPAKTMNGDGAAGDAFAAAMLLGLHEEWELQRCLLTAVCVATAALNAPSGYAGDISLASALKLPRKLTPYLALED